MHYLFDEKTANPEFKAFCLFFLLCLCLSVLKISICLGSQHGGAPPFGIPYEIKIKGVSDRKLLEELKAISDTISLKSHLPGSAGLLRRRVERDRTGFLKVLKAQGYYGAHVKADMDFKDRPVQIVFRVNTGPQYLVKSIEFQTASDKDTFTVNLPEANSIGLVIGQPLKAEDILGASKKLLRNIEKQGFPFPRIIDRQVVVDHADYSGSVKFRIDPGPQACFGKTIISGLKSVNETLVYDMVPWKEGDSYSPDLTAELQNRLTDSGLFAAARVVAGQDLDENGRLPVVIEVSERKHRTVGLGVNYKTDEGPGVKLSWEHRNFLHRGERLALSTAVSDFTKEFDSGFRKPYFMHYNQTLQFSLRIATDEPDAYTSRNIKGTAFVDRKLDKKVTIGAGLGFKASEVEQIEEDEHYGLIFLPLTFDWNTSNDLLDPTQGGRIFMQVAPYYDMMGSDSNFLKGYASYRHYISVLERPLLVFAGKIGLGAIEGADLGSIPADERFYAGGGGSIRGYAYQYVGPLADGEPFGGQSLVDFSGELRVKLTDRLGMVTFLDGGSAFANTFSGSSEKLRWGTGAGLRYYTPIGPLRFDVAVPLNRRTGIDDRFQIYVSLGQAF